MAILALYFFLGGGGKRPAALVPVLGIERVMLLFKRLAQHLPRMPPPRPSYGVINGLPGFVTLEADGVPQ